jgi:hypothetical protein
MRSFVLLLFLLIPAVADAQIVLGGPKPTADEVSKAKAVLAAAEAKEVLWNVGEFDLLVRGETAKGDVQFDSTDDSILALEEIPAGVVLWFNDVRAGQKERALHKFKAETQSYWVARAVKEGKTTIKVWANGDAGKPPRIIARLDVQVGKPKPPDPGPGPGPGPTPIPAQGLRVLIVWETKDLSTYPASQIAAVNAREVREYLNAKCIKVGTQPEWRVYDPDTDVSRESKIWQDAMKIKRDKLPWIVVSDGVKGTSEPLPLDKDALMTLLKTYGGN